MSYICFSDLYLNMYMWSNLHLCIFVSILLLGCGHGEQGLDKCSFPMNMGPFPNISYVFLYLKKQDLPPNDKVSCKSHYHVTVFSYHDGELLATQNLAGMYHCKSYPNDMPIFKEDFVNQYT